MRPWPPAVLQDLGVLAAGVLKCIGKDRHRGEVPGVVHLLCEVYHCGGEPGWIESDGVEGVAEDVSEQ